MKKQTILGGTIVAIFLGLIVIGLANTSNTTRDNAIDSSQVDFSAINSASSSTEAPPQSTTKATEEKQIQPAPTPKATYYKPMTFPQTVENNRSSWISTCSESGGNTNYCNCTFDFLISNYGYVWLLQANANYETTGRIAPEFGKAYQKCAVYKT